MISGLRQGTSESQKLLRESYEDTLKAIINKLWPSCESTANLLKQILSSACELIRCVEPAPRSLESWLTGIASEHVREAMLGQCGINDAAAWDCIQGYYCDTVISRLSQLMLSSDDAEGLAPSVFSRAREVYRRFNPDWKPFDVWLEDIAKDVLAISLLQRCKSADEDAWRQIMDNYRGFVRSVVVSHSRGKLSDQDIEDAVQNTFVKLHQNIGRFDPTLGIFEAWLGRIARNTAISMIRKLIARREVLYDDQDFLQKSDGSDLEGLYITREKVEQVRHVIEIDLTPYERLTILLYHFHSLTYEEIAKIMSLPPNSNSWVKNRLCRGRAKIRRILK